MREKKKEEGSVAFLYARSEGVTYSFARVVEMTSQCQVK